MWKYPSKYPTIEMTIIILCFTLIFGIIAGCTGTSTISTPTNPIIGSWKTTYGFGQQYTSEITFFENGKAIADGTGGTWEKYDNTHYALAVYKYPAEIFIYDPQLDTLTKDVRVKMVYQRI